MIEAAINDDVLTITVPLQPPAITRSGLTSIVASTPGPVITFATHDGHHIFVEVVAYIQHDAEERREAAHLSMSRMLGLVK